MLNSKPQLAPTPEKSGDHTSKETLNRAEARAKARTRGRAGASVTIMRIKFDENLDVRRVNRLTECGDIPFCKHIIAIAVKRDTIVSWLRLPTG